MKYKVQQKMKILLIPAAACYTNYIKVPVTGMESESADTDSEHPVSDFSFFWQNSD
ncbi:MAG: hypothetical protein SOY12_06325 [Schaedlerella sp.]|nr:hypothetical protein [Lachnospiraceae bacterium]MDY4202643.1 hypothetical protein [Schaedlerella sp.]